MSVPLMGNKQDDERHNDAEVLEVLSTPSGEESVPEEIQAMEEFEEESIRPELKPEAINVQDLPAVQVVEEVQEEVLKEEPEAPPTTSQKKHIPFNVVMTKQDRDRFQQKRKESTFLNIEGSNDKNFEEYEITKKQAKPEPIEIEKTVEAEPIEMVKKTVEAEPIEIEKATDPDPIQLGQKGADSESFLLQKKVIEAGAMQFEEKAAAADEQDRDLPYYAFPSIDLLSPPAHAESDQEWLQDQATLLNDTLKNFNVRAHVVNVTQGPAVTRFEVQPEPGVKVNKITNLTDDIKLSLAAQDIRMEAPIPGKHTIGIEIPNRKSKPVFLREVLESDAFQQDGSPLTVALGLDISGQPMLTDLKKMPHGLIAGATGSGKSVCINTMLVSLLYKATPQELKLLLIDPKMVELAPYNRIPHLVSPVITDVKAATAALKWAVEEMERRYELFAHTGVRDIGRFNQLADRAGQHADKLPYIVVVIDELADLMMMSPADVEEAICRIAQKARACGIHLIVATQRPSVDVITGLIKANIPTRIAFSVSSQVDSRTILDASGAEKLLGKGDMLFAENGSSKTVRLQGTFVSDDEIEQVVGHVKQEQEPNYLFEQDELLSRAQVIEETDELFYEACEFAVNQNGASASSLQRRFHIGYNRAARLIEMMERQGILSESRGSKPRDVLISVEELEYILESNGGN
ncbi:DNA translocase FtsK [Bacillus sp. V5-8f]|nr:DNA translocase FtsK [Bacillus sp. V5-8f]